jgi:tetratricopeptide (TPR) repeat protein
MNRKSLWISIIAVIISFVGGFILANALNRSEMDALRAETARVQKNPSENNPELTLSDEEIRQRITEADRNQTNFGFQKKLGLALYRYAVMKKDENLWSEAEKILKRANALDEKDYEVIVTLGHLNFDTGLFKNDNERFAKAREFYQKALIAKPNDVDVRTDYGITYFLQNPPDNDKAVAEFNKSLKENPQHEKTLQFLTQVLLKQGKTKEAETALAKLKEINPNTPTLAEIEAQNSDETTPNK